ncbi:separin [Phyllopteryx taeniolatus]|uniref:separin n=1 Tax=Phyllopteryx taeniolatus TaxID=161469 RepID=UPI002AD5A3E2|nr:separin [Phyllopteryx taeniolatus]XP_061641412.1 separin [Phyllopteryx taeniolatus]
MKCMKVDYYIKRTASANEAQLFYQELERLVKNGHWFQGRTQCDRVVRACNDQLGLGSLDFDHISQLIKLVELAIHGYDINTVPQNSPLYMEKIIIHIVKKLSSLQVHSLCSRVAALLYTRISSTQPGEAYYVLVRSCFSILWNGVSATTDKILNPKDKLHCQFQALSFLLLLDKITAVPSISKAPIYTEDSVSEFAKSSEVVSEEDASFVIHEMHTLFSRCLSGSQDCKINGFTQSIDTSNIYTLLEMVLVIIKMLCKAGHHCLASSFMNEIGVNVRNNADCQAAALELGKWAIEIHSMVTPDEQSDKILRECARALRSLPPDLGECEAHSVLEGCGLLVWVVENCHKKGFSGPVLLAWFSFLEAHQAQIRRILKKFELKSECSRLQQALCVSIYQGFGFAYESFLESQLEDGDTLARVLLYCQATIGHMMTEMRKLLNENLLIKAVTAVSNLTCGLYNLRLYDQAFTLLEILCHDLRKNCPASLSIDRLNRPFMLAVQTSRRTGHLERALDWVILWLKALGDKMALHKTEPISLWVKTKIDAARNSEADIRLRTIRDAFGSDILDERTMLCLLDEELRLYKEEAGDTSHERYNTLCDLLDICHEESSHTHLRAVYLCEMAQVVCFQDFSEQTDCTAVDFTHEALRLLEEEPETPENTNQLKDDKAHALLWLFICTLEKNLQEAIERDIKLQEMRKQSPCVENPIGTNDLDYEDKQKNEDNILVYDGLQFSLAAQNKLCQPLGRALTEWATLLRTQVLPSVRNPKQTSNSIVITASLFKLMGKPLQALEAYQLAIELSHQLADTQGCAYSLCQSASLFLEVGSTELALAQIERAEKMVATDKSIEELSSLSLLIILLKSQCCYSAGLVDRGVSYLCDVLKEANEQKRSKSLYMLRAQALQTCSSYLSLDTTSLPQTQRSRIIQLGYKSPDTVLCESLKLFSSLLVTFVGRGLYGDYGKGSDVRFFDTGNNLVFKWRLLSELLNCSMKMIMLRTSCGAINDARLQCREALRLAIKLQALSQCAELLVVKAELELMQGEIAESKFDLDKVRNLLEIYTDVSDPEFKSEVKIKPRKGRPLQKARSPLPVMEDDLKDILSTRWTVKEPIVRDQASSPLLKAKPHRWLSCLTHKQTCQCPCCSEPLLGRVTARWTAAQAHMVLQLDPSEAKVGFKLHWATLARCKTITAKLEAKLAEFIPLCGPAKGSPKASLMHDVVGRVYLHMAVSGLEPSHSKICSIWKVLEAGLAFVDSVPSPELKTVKAGLMATKAIVSLVTLSTKKDCRLEELFPNVWTLKAPKQLKVLKSHQSSCKEHKSLSMSEKKKQMKVKVSKPKLKVPTSTAKGKGLSPMTPVMIPMTPFSKTPVLQSKSSARELSAFDFNTVVPTLAFTPVQKAKATVQKSQKTASKLQFQVFDEFLPTQNKVQPVPAAPKRTKKSRFKMEFSDESDAENAQEEPIEKLSLKKTITRQGTRRGNAASATLAEKIQPTRQARSKKSYALPRDTSSEDETLVCRGSSKRGGRARKVSGKELELEEPDKMRAIEEETNDVLDLSFECLGTSDTETKEDAASDIDFEVLRRDLCCNFEMSDLFDKKSGHKARGPQPHNPHPDPRTDNLSFDDIQVLLRSAWLAFQHFPPLTIFPTLCAFLALSIGHQDPIATAMLHSQSLGITSRHRTIRHLASSRKKLKKASSEVADQMDNLTLDESSPTTTLTEQRLSQLENIFSFPTADCSAFPQSHCQEFIQQIQHLPSGVTVCVMSVLGVKAGEMGESILLSRLEKGSAPVTVHIPTSTEPLSIRLLVQEMDSILVDQKALCTVSEKAQWWEGRRALDYRVEQLLREMERLLGCWKSLLLPLSLDTKLSAQSQHISKILSSKGVKNSEEILKVLLSASSLLTQKDLKSFALGVCPEWYEDCEQILRSAVLQFADSEKPCGHVVLILDKYLQKLPWESISILRSRSVSRMPSLQSLIGLSIQKENDPQSILKHGVDTKNTFYVLDPDANLENSQQQFKEWFRSQLDWDGVCGCVPKLGQLEDAVATKDLYIYLGHGAGARFLDSQVVLMRPMRAASLLIGCSSAALAVRGDQEGQGIILNYLIAGCPFVLGNLWDVTDRDIDRFTKALLESWLSSESGSALLDYMGPSRQATHLKHLIGAAPVVYGLPIQLR